MSLPIGHGATIGVIGGSGLYEIEGLTDIERVALSTPFGAPSDEYLVGRLGDAKLVFLPRHGRGHRILPHEINFRANIHGMKQLGVEWILSVSAVGLDEGGDPPRRHRDRRPVHRSHQGARGRRFFGDGVAGHVGFADPVCSDLAAHVYDAAQGGGRARAPGRHLRGHRRAAVLDARRVARLPQLGRRRHRHDQPARGQARARGGDLLRDHRAVDRLRLLARDRGGRHASRRCWRSCSKNVALAKRDREGRGRAHPGRARAAAARARRSTR